MGTDCKPAQGEIIIYDMLGNIVKKMNIQNDKIKQTIQTSDMANGLYTYKFLTSFGKNFVGKFIIDK